jgi:hypothetical protein
MFSKFKSDSSKRKQPRQPVTRQRARRVNLERQTPAIFSYHAKRNDNYTVSDEDDSDTQRERQNLATSRLEALKAGGKRPAGRYIALLFIVVIICFELALIGRPQVVVTGDSSATIASANTRIYQQKAEQLLSRSFSSHSKLTINTQKIDTQMQSSFPELESVSTTVPFIGSAATVHIVPSKAVLADVIQGSNAVAIDARGVDISAAVGSHVAATLPRVTDQSGTQANPGHIVLPKSTVSFITTILYQFHSQGITTTDLTLPAGGSELNIKFQGVNYIAKFNLQADAREQAGALAATVKTLNNQHIVPSQYIDVRVLGRAYYL